MCTTDGVTLSTLQTREIMHLRSGMEPTTKKFFRLQVTITSYLLKVIIQEIRFKVRYRSLRNNEYEKTNSTYSDRNNRDILFPADPSV